MHIHLWFLGFCLVNATSDDGAAAAPQTIQRIELTFASAEDVGGAELRLAPVYGDRAWAFSARWDDNQPNSLIMREHMARFGIPGTFYLNRSDEHNPRGPQPVFGVKYLRELLRDGGCIGGHTQTHPKLPALPNANQVFQEILANRIERECEADQPIVSFAFPGGQFDDPSRPERKEAVTRALVHAGYQHCVYSSFVKGNRDLLPGQMTSGYQVQPGDREVNEEKFNAALNRLLALPPDQREWHQVFLGVHAWQQGDEWKKLDVIFAKLPLHGGWWFCNQNQYAAYAWQLAHATLKSNGPAVGVRRTYVLARPAITELGAAVPLTLIVKGRLQAARLDDQSLKPQPHNDGALLDLPLPSAERLPQRIDLAGGSETAGLQATLSWNAATKRLALALANRGEAPLTNVRLKVYLPPASAKAIVYRRLETLASGASDRWEIPLVCDREGDYWQGGTLYAAAAVDYCAAGQTLRAYAPLLR